MNIDAAKPTKLITNPVLEKIKTVYLIEYDNGHAWNEVTPECICFSMESANKEKDRLNKEIDYSKIYERAFYTVREIKVVN